MRKIPEVVNLVALGSPEVEALCRHCEPAYGWARVAGGNCALTPPITTGWPARFSNVTVLSSSLGTSGGNMGIAAQAKTSSAMTRQQARDPRGQCG